VQLQVDLDWELCGQVTVSGEALTTPSLPSAPGVYQWVFRHAGHERRYVGEAANLSRRFQHYRTPGPSQTTNLRMNQRAKRVIANRGSVEIMLATKIRLVVDGATSSPDLNSPFVRRFVENAALLSLVASNCGIVNGAGYGELTNEVLR